MKLSHIILTTVLFFFASCAIFSPGNIPVTELSYPSELTVISRTDWGSKPLEKALPVHDISKITIHHGGEDFPVDKDPIQYLRNLQTWSMSDAKNWIDIPYHFMIDLEANIYEARPINYPGATNTTYDPTGHALICVMGNYENQIITDDQLDAIVNLTVFLASKYDVAPEDIKGHKDYTETLCPGKDLYRYLKDGTIVRKVQEKLSFSK